MRLCIVLNESSRKWPLTLLNLSFKAVEEKGKQVRLTAYCILNVVRFRSRPAFQPEVGENVDLTAVLTTTPSLTSTYLGYGRIFQRQTTPFISINILVVAGIRHEAADSGDDTPSDLARRVVYPCSSDSHNKFVSSQRASDPRLELTL